jgi:hypothetical protein
MNTELLEKIDSLRKDLRAIAAQAKLNDPKKLADLLEEKYRAMERDYQELRPYMTLRQVDSGGMASLRTFAQLYPERGHEREFTDLFAELVTTEVWRMIDNLDAIEATLRWLCAIADHMGCSLPELLRYQPPHPWFVTPDFVKAELIGAETKTTE